MSCLNDTRLSALIFNFQLSTKQKPIDMKKYFFTSVFFALVCGAQLFAQTNTGEEFMVAFGRNDDNASITGNSTTGYNVELILRIIAPYHTDVRFSFMENPALDTTITVKAGEIYDFKLSHARANAAYSGTGYDKLTPNKKSIRVSSTAPISLIAMSSAHA
jgi:hypothetical protein